jgi:hypothetical protein
MTVLEEIINRRGDNRAMTEIAGALLALDWLLLRITSKRIPTTRRNDD